MPGKDALGSKCRSWRRGRGGSARNSSTASRTYSFLAQVRAFGFGAEGLRGSHPECFRVVCLCVCVCVCVCEGACLRVIVWAQIRWRKERERQRSRCTRIPFFRTSELQNKCTSVPKLHTLKLEGCARQLDLFIILLSLLASFQACLCTAVGFIYYPFKLVGIRASGLIVGIRAH
jgi:hypothetical protein